VEDRSIEYVISRGESKKEECSRLLRVDYHSKEVIPARQQLKCQENVVDKKHHAQKRGHYLSGSLALPFYECLNFKPRPIFKVHKVPCRKRKAISSLFDFCHSCVSYTKLSSDSSKCMIITRIGIFTIMILLLIPTPPIPPLMYHHTRPQATRPNPLLSPNITGALSSL
jgi:hypothetical protein